MRAPDFWRENGAAARLLAPLGALYGALAENRLRRPAPRAETPAIAIGGLTAGGDGKTPLALALARLLVARGERPAFLTRGYGREKGRSEPFLLDANRDDAASAGDEPLLLARLCPTIVGVDRLAGAALARSLGASALLLDDGFHSRRLDPDFSVLAIDAHYGAGNGRCLPAGPLRAPLSAQLAAADALVLIGEGAPGTKLAQQSGKSLLRARLIPDREAASTLAGARVVAFAAIARPEKFFRTLAETGAEIVATRSFPDHRRFDEEDMRALLELASRLRARLVTTEKDYVRVPHAARSEVATLPVALEFDAPARAILDAALARARLNRAS